MKSLGVTRDQAFGFVEALAKFKETKSPEELIKIANEVSALGLSQKKLAPEMQKFVQQISELGIKALRTADGLKQAEKLINSFEASVKESNPEVVKAKESIEGMVSALKLQSETLGKSDRETAIYIATLSKASEEELKAINTAYDKIEAYDQETQSNKDRTAALKEYEAQMMRELALEAKLLDAKIKRGETVTGQAEGIAATGIDPLAKLAADREAQLAIITEYEALETANHQLAVEARAAIDAEYEAGKLAAAEKSFAMQSEGNKMLMDGLNSLSGTVSQVFTGMITQTMSAKEAMASLANAILNDAINSLVQMGLQAVKNAILSKTLESATAITSAAAGATVAAAWAPAAAAVSLASFGANAVPAATGIASTYGLASALSIGGARNYGGGVGYGSNYEVAEGGRTELYVPQHGNPMLMGSKGGQVVSNSDLMSAMGGGGGQANIDIQIINQGTPQEVTGKQQGFDEATGRQFLKLWVSDFGSKGQTFRAVTTGTNAKGRTN